MSVPAARARSVGGSYYGGLDGLRALAVVGVLLYHGGVSWAGGGFLGVELFFVLSGFLITSLHAHRPCFKVQRAVGVQFQRDEFASRPSIFENMIMP